MYSYKKQPDFLLIGSMKSGTTSLYNDLSMLNSLYLPSEKEPAILAKFSKQDEIKREYSKHFKGAKKNQLCGEASTVYTSMPMVEGVIERAYALCGNELKLIMIMRDPLDRIYSHLRHDIAGEHININKIDQVVIEDCRYVAVSNYAMQLKPWIDTFGNGNLFCLSFIEFSQNRAKTLAHVAKFLGVEIERSTNINKNISNKSSELRRTGKGVNFAIQSNIYRNYIRPALSDKIREAARKVILPKVKVPEFKLSASVEEELRLRLINVESEVESLIGKKIRINRID